MVKKRDKKKVFLEIMNNVVGYEWKTYPMVFLNNKFIGGYMETKKYFESISNNELQINEDF